MMKNLHDSPPRTLRKLFLAAGCSLLPLASFAQTDTNAAVQIKPTVVTGSLIPTAETVGPAPIETVSSADIQKTGTQDILSALRSQSPAFSGNANVGQALNNGGYGEAYIALRNLPT